MLTQSAPAIIQTLTGVLPPEAVKQLTQALANCSQPLTHRGPINFSPKEPNQSGPGYVTGGRWNPQSPDLSELLGRIFDVLGTQVDTPGWGGPGGVNNYNYQGDTFNMPIQWNPSTNEYYGGPNVYNAGDSYNNSTYSNTVNTTEVNTQNINTTTINNLPPPGGGGGGPWGGPSPGLPPILPIPFPAEGPRGPRGLQGPAGSQGDKGDKGDTGATGAKGDKGDKGDTGATGATGPSGISGSTSITYVTDVFCNNDGTIGKTTATITVGIPA